MDKLKMQSENLVDENVGKIAKFFPNCITEGKDENGNVIKAVDFDLLKQELSKVLVDGNDERYMLNWAGKKQSILTANSPINATLRPCKEESVGKDGKNGGFNSENLYIEGDNLDVLKLLRETYLNKIKMIYIDPPYNTGNDFVYNDDFASSVDEYLQNSKSYDEEGNRMVQNLESNGRFHSNWLSMMYPRLKLAKDLLDKDCGSIFISIDDSEVANLKKICDEIFGEHNYVTCIPRITKLQRSGQEKYMDISHDYIIVYSFSEDFEHIIERVYDFTKIKQDKIGKYLVGDTKAILAAKSQGYSKGGDYDFEYNGKIYKPIDKNGIRNRWLWTKDRMQKAADLGILVETKNTLRMQLYLDKKFDEITNTMVDKNENLIFHTADFMNDSSFTNSSGYNDLNNLLGNGTPSNMYPKPVNLIKKILSFCADKETIVLDFFSGSATTAHAVMQLNAEDGGNRKFIMVQLPEKCDENSEAYKAGYKNICEIGKERIRRAGKKIVEDLKKYANPKAKDWETWDENGGIDGSKDKVKLTYVNENGKLETEKKDISKKEDYYKFHSEDLDIGFRVLKLDSSNMKDVYYNPVDINQDLLSQFENNIKEDRNPEDLLFQVMLDMGIMLSQKIEEKTIAGKKVYIVGEYDEETQPNLICCFDSNVSEEVVTEIAKLKPLYAVFRDSSMSTDSMSVNFDQIFATHSPSTTRKVL